MNTNEMSTAIAITDRKTLLSTLWIFAMLNYIYCDVLGLMNPDMLKGFLAGNVSGLQVTPGFLLGASIMMEVPTAMVLLSRVLKPAGNRWANIIGGAFMTLVQVGSLFMGSGPTPYYVFFSVIEIACTAFIIWYAWTWSAREVVSEPKVQATGRI